MRRQFNFSYKTNQMGDVVKFKASLVADGRTQVQDVEYDEGFARTPSAAAVKTVLAVAVQEDLQLFHVDT